MLLFGVNSKFGFKLQLWRLTCEEVLGFRQPSCTVSCTRSRFVENASVFLSTKYAWYGYWIFACLTCVLCAADFRKNLFGLCFMSLSIIYHHLNFVRVAKICSLVNLLFWSLLRRVFGLRMKYYTGIFCWGYGNCCLLFWERVHDHEDGWTVVGSVWLHASYYSIEWYLPFLMM